MDKSKVLVIDDDGQIRRIVKAILSKDYEVREVSSVAEAFKEIEGGFVPRVAVVDYMMPGANGDEFIKRVPPDVCTCIVLTAKRIDSEFITNMLNSGAMYTLKKPFSVNELKAMVRRALEATQQGEGHGETAGS